MNQILIAGHLGADPEVRFTSGGQKVTTLRVACNSRKSGKDETIWWKVTAWGEQFDKLISYLKKGSPLMVSGELSKPEIFTDREGKPQISMNITANNIMFSPFGKSEGRSSEESNSYKGNQQKQEANSNHGFSFGDSQNMQPAHMMYGHKESAEFEDEIPF